MIKAGIFDLGGVLATPSNFDHIAGDICSALNIEKDVFLGSWNKLYDSFGKGLLTEDEVWKTIKKETKFTKELPQESLFIREYRKQYQKTQEVFDIVDELKKQKIKLALLSNIIKPHADFNRDSGNFKDFDLIVFSNEVGMRKPDPEIFRYTLRELGSRAEETFVVDDAERNVEMAKRLGMQGILFQNIEKLKNDLAKMDIKV